MTAQERLKKFIQDNMHGGCRILSQGDRCECPLCDLDRVIQETRAARGDGVVALEDVPDNELPGMWERADFM